MRALETIGGFCTNDSNLSVVLRYFDPILLGRINALTSLKDVILCVYLLECLYNMSELGEVVCNRMAEQPKMIDTLVHLASVETVSFGQNGLIGMKVVEYGNPRLQNQLQQQPASSSMIRSSHPHNQLTGITSPSPFPTPPTLFPQSVNINVPLIPPAAHSVLYSSSQSTVDSQPLSRTPNGVQLTTQTPSHVQGQMITQQGSCTVDQLAPPPPLLSPCSSSPAVIGKQRTSRLLSKPTDDKMIDNGHTPSTFAATTTGHSPPPHLTPANQNSVPMLSPPVDEYRRVTSSISGTTSTSDERPSRIIPNFASPTKNATNSEKRKRIEMTRSDANNVSDVNNTSDKKEETELSSISGSFRGPALIMQQNEQAENVALTWLKQNCEVDLSAVVSRAELYSAYVQAISQNPKEVLSTMVVSVNVFANLIRQVFPSCQLQQISHTDSANCKSPYMQVKGVKFVPVTANLNINVQSVSQNTTQNAPSSMIQLSSNSAIRNTPIPTTSLVASQHPLMQQILEQKPMAPFPNMNTNVHTSNRGADSIRNPSPGPDFPAHYIHTHRVGAVSLSGSAVSFSPGEAAIPVNMNTVTDAHADIKMENGEVENTSITSISLDSNKVELKHTPNRDSLKNLLINDPKTQSGDLYLNAFSTICRPNHQETDQVGRAPGIKTNSDTAKHTPVDFSDLNTELSISIPSNSTAIDAEFNKNVERSESVEQIVSLAVSGGAEKTLKPSEGPVRSEQTVPRFPNGVIKSVPVSSDASYLKINQLTPYNTHNGPANFFDEKSNHPNGTSSCYSPGPNAERMKMNIDQSFESIHEYLTNTVVAAVVEEMEPERQRIKTAKKVPSRVNDTICDIVEFVTNNSSMLEPSPSRARHNARKSVSARAPSDGTSNQGSSTTGSPMSSSTCSSVDSPIASVLACLKRSHDGSTGPQPAKTPRRRRRNRNPSTKVPLDPSVPNKSAFDNSKAVNVTAGQKPSRWVVKPTVDDVVEAVAMASKLATSGAVEKPESTLKPSDKVFRLPLPVSETPPPASTFMTQPVSGPQNLQQRCPTPRSQFIQIQQQPSTSNTLNLLVMKYACEWDRCEKFFDNANQVSYHCFHDHLPNDENARYLCKWSRCDRYPRRKWSLMSHIQDIHCNERALKTAAMRRQEISLNGFTKIPEPRVGSAHPGYPADAAIAAIRRHAFVNLPKDFTEEHEGPVTKSLRLASCLTLRNLAKFSQDARRQLKKYEPSLCWMAFSRLKNATILAQCLAELYQFSACSSAEEQDDSMIFQNDESMDPLRC